MKYKPTTKVKPSVIGVPYFIFLKGCSIKKKLSKLRNIKDPSPIDANEAIEFR